MNFPQVGQILSNGHTVDAAYCVGDARYVLAHREGEHEQFVVWRVDQDGDTVNGHYFDNPVAAQKKFNECCFDWWPEVDAERNQPSDEDIGYLRELAEGAISNNLSERQQTIYAVVQQIIERMEEKDKGNLTTRYVIGILQEAITRLEANALMSPAKDYLLKAES